MLVGLNLPHEVHFLEASWNISYFNCLLVWTLKWEVQMAITCLVFEAKGDPNKDHEIKATIMSICNLLKFKWTIMEVVKP